jgi:hypothetical protein
MASAAPSSVRTALTLSSSDSSSNNNGGDVHDEFVIGTLTPSRESEAAQLLAHIFVSSHGMEHAMGITDPSIMEPFTNIVIR